jgi:hypothetical protein
MALGWVNLTNSSQAIAEAWDGTHWTLLPAPSPDGLFAVSCTSSSICRTAGEGVRSGNALTTFVQRWNGSGWSHDETPNLTLDNYFYSISCPKDASCVAVGEDQVSGQVYGLVESLSDGSWSIVPSPNP